MKRFKKRGHPPSGRQRAVRNIRIRSIICLENGGDASPSENREGLSLSETCYLLPQRERERKRDREVQRDAKRERETVEFSWKQLHLKVDPPICIYLPCCNMSSLVSHEIKAKRWGLLNGVFAQECQTHPRSLLEGATGGQSELNDMRAPQNYHQHP